MLCFRIKIKELKSPIEVFFWKYFLYTVFKILLSFVLQFLLSSEYKILRNWSSLGSNDWVRINKVKMDVKSINGTKFTFVIEMYWIGVYLSSSHDKHFCGYNSYAELSNTLKFQKHITLFLTWQCWVCVHPGETALLHVVILEPRLLLSLASSIPKISSSSVSISRRGRDLEKCLWEFIIGQDATSVSLLLHWPICRPVATEEAGKSSSGVPLEGQWIFMENQLCPCRSKIVTPKEK